MKKLLLVISIISILNADAVYRVPIEGTIDLGLPPFIQRMIDKAESENATAIIFDINTFGGRVDAATQIKDAILGSDITTIAFINRRAISAGALISLSCEKIYMTGGGLIGAATAVDMSGKKGSEKVISFMREEMASTAEKRGRNKEIARGMVDEELNFSHLVINGDSISVNDIEGRKDGKLISLTTEQAIKYRIADGTAESIEALMDTLSYGSFEVKESSENSFHAMFIIDLAAIKETTLSCIATPKKACCSYPEYFVIIQLSAKVHITEIIVKGIKGKQYDL